MAVECTCPRASTTMWRHQRDSCRKDKATLSNVMSEGYIYFPRAFLLSTMTTPLLLPAPLLPIRCAEQTDKQAAVA